MGNIIEISGLNKSFGDVMAVRDLSFTVGEGDLFAFLGQNGAGKSTTINILCGCLEKDGGRVIVDGYDIDKDIEKIKGGLGVVFQSSRLDKNLSVKSNLKNRAALYGIYGDEFMARMHELARLLKFEDILDRTLGKLSGGQRRRIDIARALLPKPKLLVLDEPTTGLDPQTRKLLWSVISDLRKSENLTVFLTTHYMEEAAEANHVLILDKGSVCAFGSPLELKNRYTRDFVTVYGVKEEKIKALSVPYEAVADGYRLSVKNTSEATALITKYPELFVDYEVTKGKMDDVFLAVTGKTLGGEEK